MTTWLDDCRKYSSKDITIMLIGNKVRFLNDDDDDDDDGMTSAISRDLTQVDLEDQRQVSKEEAQKFADDHELAFFEVRVRFV